MRVSYSLPSPKGEASNDVMTDFWQAFLGVHPALIVSERTQGGRQKLNSEYIKASYVNYNVKVSFQLRQYED